MIIFLIQQYSKDLSQKSILGQTFHILLVKALEPEKGKDRKAIHT